MDALSEALNAVRMTSAIFFNARFTAPWGFAAPHVDQLVPILTPGAERLVPYHLVCEGKAVVRIDGAADTTVAAGDIVIIPHGDPHTVSNGSPSALIDSAASLRTRRDLSLVGYGGGGEATRFVCGFFGCERQAGRLFLAGLPRVIKVNIRGNRDGEWLESSLRYLVAETRSDRPGGVALLSKMAEALFVEALRRYMEEMLPEQTGWLAGARDPIVGAALVLLQGRPRYAWTLAELACEVGASRSVLAERFARILGVPPLTYLARWRLQLAARKLQTTRSSILQVAWNVGYGSEAAFNRAFKREFGLPPAQYRKEQSHKVGGRPWISPGARISRALSELEP